MSFATSSDYFRMNNNIFDVETDEKDNIKPKLSAVQMRVLAVLYSIAPFKATSSANSPFNSYKVKVRQSVLAQKCGCSVSTVKRAVSGLIEKGYIDAKARCEYYKDNTKRLGTYTYFLPQIVNKGYFYVNRKALSLLTKTQTRVYLFICKCVRSNSLLKTCWNSFNDIARQLKLHRNAVVKTIKELVELKVIGKWHNTDDNGKLHYDNTYRIIDIEAERQSEMSIEEFFKDLEDNSESQTEADKESQNVKIQELLNEFVEDEPAEKEELPLVHNDSSTIFKNRDNKFISESNYTSFNDFSQCISRNITEIFSIPRAGP